MSDKRKGYVEALGAYVLWGIFPLYWRLFENVSSLEVICHRIVWSLVTLLAFTTLMYQWGSVHDLLRSKRRLALCSLAAVLISINWLVFIWAVQNNYVVEASLGYFINPLLTVLLAVIFFRESISLIQWTSILLALLGVAVMTWTTGSFPVVAFCLAISFALYSAVKKRTTMPAISGLGMETAILAPLSIGALIYFQSVGTGTSFDSLTTFAFLVVGGPVTTLPLVLFAHAAKTVPLVAMGMLQYIGPTIQFLLAYFYFQEDISIGRLVGFLFVWVALALFAWGTFLVERQKKTLTGPLSPMIE